MEVTESGYAQAGGAGYVSISHHLGGNTITGTAAKSGY